LMKHTMLGNPLIQPWKELAAITDRFDMSERLFASYYICRAIKPDDATAAGWYGAPHDDAVIDEVFRIAAE
jgi:hypothetical protein